MPTAGTPAVLAARAAVCAAALLLAGCATRPDPRDFDDVRRGVADRLGREVHWDRGTIDDRKVRERVDHMLAGELSPEQAVQIALLRNPSLQAAYEDLGVAQADLVQAGLLSNPIFEAEVRFAEAGGGTAVEMAVVQEFVGLLQIPARRRLAREELAAAKLRVTGEVLATAGRTRGAYYELGAALRSAALRETAAEAADAARELTQRLYDAGNVTELELAERRAAAERARLEALDADAAAALARERLALLMGAGGHEGWSVPADLPEPPGDEAAADLAARARERSVELALARREIAAAARRLGLERRSGLVPELEAGASAEREPEGEWAVGPAVALPIPLFDQGQGRTARALAELRGARQRYRAVAAGVASAARSAELRLTAARRRAEAYRDGLLPLRARIVELAHLQYNAMQLGPMELLDAKTAELEATEAYAEALRDYWLARSAVGQLLAGGTPEDQEGEPRRTGRRTSAVSSHRSGGH